METQASELLSILRDAGKADANKQSNQQVACKGWKAKSMHTAEEDQMIPVSINVIIGKLVCHTKLQDINQHWP